MSDNPQKKKTISYDFEFLFEDGLKKTFTVNLESVTLDIITSPPTDDAPDWTRLTHCQCPNCPLDPALHLYCPIAINLVDLVDFFKHSLSYEKTDLRIKTERRTSEKQTSLQEGVSSLMGMYMVTSGCPIMDKLRPMLRAHIPFSTAQETQYRQLSMYLLAQYFLYKKGKTPDWDMEKLKLLFQDIQVVNQNFWKRFASAQIEDASLNALVLLDSQAQYVAFSIDVDLLTETEALFQAYFD